jgi:hypothetical protein
MIKFDFLIQKVEDFIDKVIHIVNLAKDTIKEKIYNGEMNVNFKEDTTAQPLCKSPLESFCEKVENTTVGFCNLLDDSVKKAVQEGAVYLSDKDFSVETLYNIFIYRNVTGDNLEEISRCIENKKLDILKKAYENPNLVISDEFKKAGLEIAVMQNNSSAFKIIANCTSGISKQDFKRLLSYPHLAQNNEMINTIITETKDKIFDGLELSKDIYSELFQEASYNFDENILRGLIKNVPDKISKEAYGFGLNIMIQKENFHLLHLFKTIGDKFTKQDIEQAQISLSFVSRKKNIYNEQQEKNLLQAKKLLKILEKGINNKPINKHSAFRMHVDRNKGKINKTLSI